ncbi:hypothetical protein K3G63_14740 [Hymenobacter sp. HSC-4F20]|uniref:hypothetical protein n=1 Tax=Hymenobacter sp. HSC-4F20 TaxID=2864135 RepID=UPI001C737D61|nr:hypothetical protein [Hymenobacter sp. HSC-4F20]MBX0291705.1 hypothetical protein [Hymenobacter sp. HSC-4F20]
MEEPEYLALIAQATDMQQVVADALHVNVVVGSSGNDKDHIVGIGLVYPKNIPPYNLIHVNPPFPLVEGCQMPSGLYTPSDFTTRLQKALKARVSTYKVVTRILEAL